MFAERQLEAKYSKPNAPNMLKDRLFSASPSLSDPESTLRNGGVCCPEETDWMPLGSRLCREGYPPRGKGSDLQTRQRARCIDLGHIRHRGSHEVFTSGRAYAAPLGPCNRGEQQRAAAAAAADASSRGYFVSSSSCFSRGAEATAAAAAAAAATQLGKAGITHTIVGAVEQECTGSQPWSSTCPRVVVWSG